MPGIKKIIIPENISFTNPISGEKFGNNNFNEFCHLFLNLEVFKESVQSLRIALSLSTILSKTKPGDEVLLNADDLLKLSDTVSKNFNTVLNQNPVFLMQLLPFLDTLINAQDA